MHQVVRVGQLSLILVVPADVDAVMDMYIERGGLMDLTAQHGKIVAVWCWQSFVQPQTCERQGPLCKIRRLYC